MGEKLYKTVGQFGIRVPAHIAHLCEPSEVDRRNHGIEWERGHQCDACKHKVEFKDRPIDGRCPSCEKPWPVRCMGSACDSLIQHDYANGTWYQPYPYCKSCEDTRCADNAQEMLKEIPQSTLVNAIDGWRRAAHRVEAEKESDFWVSHDLGRNFGDMTGIYLYGDVGTGKTTIAARYAAKAIKAGCAGSFLWVKEYDLMMAAKATGYDEKKKTATLFSRLEHAGLAVIDEMFAVSEALSENTKIMIGQAIAKRFEAKLPTIVTSNHEPAWAALYDVRVNSRFNGMFKVIHLRGPDLRQHFGGGHE